MGAVMQLAEQSVIYAKAHREFDETSLELTSNPKSKSMMSEVSQLKAEVHMLREELARAERRIGQRDLLLENARIREMEMRLGLYVL